MSIKGLQRVTLVLVGLTVLITLAVLGVHRLFFGTIKTPSKLKEAGIRVGSGLFQRSVIIHNSELGLITALDVCGGADNGQHKIVAVGQTGAVVVDPEGNLLKSIAFERATTSPFGESPGDNERDGIIQVLYRDNCHIFGFLVRNHFHRAELISYEGKTLWTFGQGYLGDSWLEDMSGGDINGDGRPEYVALFSNPGRIVKLDESLHPIWSIPGVKARHVEIMHSDRDGKLEIAHDDSSRIVLRDSKGRITRQSETGHYVGSFSLLRWPTSEDRQYILHLSEGRIRLLDITGARIFEYAAPLSEDLLNISGTMVKLNPGQPAYFAALADYGPYKRSVLYVYDNSGELVYQEVLPYACSSIAAVELGGKGMEALLVGGDGEVLQYRLKRLSGRAQRHGWDMIQ